MPSRCQPRSLFELSEDAVASGLVSTCYEVHELTHRGGAWTQARTLAFARHQVRPFWNASVPSLVRRRVLDKCMDRMADAIREGHSISSAVGNVSLYLLHVILNTDISELRVQLCCYYGCSHQAALLKLLATEACKGLVSLELARQTLFSLDTQLFQKVLLSTTNLKRLVLKNIASDKILKTIGQSCSQLEVLDVSHSSQVTDNGIKHLLLKVEIKDKLNNFKREKIQTTMSWWNVIKTISRKIKVKTVSDGSKMNNFSVILEYCQQPTKLCSTLCTLNIANTSVTSHGIAIALKNIPKLETLGEYCHIGKALELLDKSAILSTKLQLTMANACRTTSSRLQLLCNICTKLNRLTITEPLHSPMMLSQLPKTLTFINLQNVPTDNEWLDGLYKFLSGPQSQNLRQLFLKFRREHVLQTVDLSIFLPKLVNLETLSIDGVQSTFHSDSSNIILRKLEKIQLSHIDSPNTLQQLLECTPSLKVLHVYTCLGLNSSELINILNTTETFPAKRKQISKSLNCIYINDLTLANINTVKCIMDFCPEINKIGNINNWDISQEEIKKFNAWKHKNNFKLEIHANSHWFCSECFPIL